jgi:hypothetical protein
MKYMREDWRGKKHENFSQIDPSSSRKREKFVIHFHLETLFLDKISVLVEIKKIFICKIFFLSSPFRVSIASNKHETNAAYCERGKNNLASLL